MSEWCLGHTAPKDGTEILVFGSKLGIQIAEWVVNFDCGHSKNTGWLVQECEDQYYNFVADESLVSHWMPLPQPPETDT